MNHFVGALKYIQWQTGIPLELWLSLNLITPWLFSERKGSFHRGKVNKTDAKSKAFCNIHFISIWNCKNSRCYKKLQLLLDQSTQAVLLILIFLGQKIPSCGKFNKKDCFGSSLFIIPVKHYRALTKWSWRMDLKKKNALSSGYHYHMGHLILYMIKW